MFLYRPSQISPLGSWQEMVPCWTVMRQGRSFRWKKGEVLCEKRLFLCLQSRGSSPWKTSLDIGQWFFGDRVQCVKPVLFKS